MLTNTTCCLSDAEPGLCVFVFTCVLVGPETRKITGMEERDLKERGK